MTRFVIILAVIFHMSKTFAQENRFVQFAFNDVRRFDEIVNLTPTRNPHTLEISEGEDGFDIFGTRKVTLNFVNQVFNDLGLTSGTDSFSVLGLFPIFDSYISLKRHVDQKSDYKLNIPYQSEDLKDWRAGDALYFQAQGGLAINLSIGVTPSSVLPLAGSTRVAAYGGFSVYVEKKSESSVFIEIRKIYTHGYTLLAGSFGFFGEVTRLNEATKGLNFLIDISKPKGREVYSKLLRTGLADFAQEDDEGVVRIGKVDSKKNFSPKKVSIATPFIPFIDFSRGIAYEKRREQRSDIWGRDSDFVSYRRGKLRSHRVFSKGGEKTRYFEAVEDAKTNRLIDASLTVEVKRNHFKTRGIKKAVTYLFKRTGLDFFKELEIPFENEKFGYAKLGARLKLGKTLKKRLKDHFDVETIKEAVKKSQKFTKKRNFTILHELIKSCGGKLEVFIEGERLARTHLSTNYSEVANCQI